MIYSTTSNRFEKFNCLPCQIPSNEFVLYSINGASKCVHPGQLLFEWPDKTTIQKTVACNVPIELRSSGFNFDKASKVAFSRVRKCFYQRGYWKLNYQYRCSLNEKWRNSTLKIKQQPKHLNGNKSRAKRWLQRRNSKRSPIHFQQSKYSTEIPENLPVHSRVLKVEATHENNSSLYYSLSVPEDSRSLNLFSLDTITGEIKVAKPLDRELLNRHVLKITAFERLDPSTSASTPVIIDLTDVQDHSPQFERTSYFAEIREDAPVGTTVMSVFARDFDDAENGEVEYRLEDFFDDSFLLKENEIVGNSSDDLQKQLHYLTVNVKSGVIQTISPLDRETTPLIRVQVVAFDHGTPSMTSTATVELSVLDVNDNPPKFTKFIDSSGAHLNSCVINISENITTPNKLLTLHAEDPDFGNNGKVHYSIVSSVAPIFSIDYITGVLTLREKPLLRQSPLTLLIRAKDGGQPANSVTVQCSINIIDINDHSPKFIGTTNGEAVYEIFVEENVPVGYELGKIFAIDEDSGLNGEIRYFLKNDAIIPPNATSTNSINFLEEIFHLDELTGALTNKKLLDREVQENYLLEVVARDNGSPPLESPLTVLVIVKDVNDNAPKFSKEVYEMELPENVSRGKEIVKLKATDLDQNKKLIYHIEFMSRNIFTLVNVGEQGAILSLTNEFLNTDEHILVIISATDQGGLQGRCNVSITVHDINSAPIFVDNMYAVRIPENSKPGFHVYKMKAVDSDRGRNAEISFFTDSTTFEIDSSSGLIVVKGELDREEQSVHSVVVLVKDNGDPTMNSSTMLEVVLEDVNDNAPIFTQNEYRVSISEEMPIGTSFFQVTAEDLDEGNNGVIDYFFDEQDEFVRMDKFRLDRTSGTVRVNDLLDRENIERFFLPLIAKDRGQPSLSTRAILQIELNDINDNPPKFEHQSYNFWVAENSPPGTVVGTLTASDLDLGENAEIKFKIFGGPDAKFFEIEESYNISATAKIVTRVEFDFESPTNKFFIEVQANSKELSSIVLVSIHVSDVNDNAPQLKDFIALVPHYEGEILNLTIGNVPAFDLDFNATLEFFMEPNEFVFVDKFGVLSLQKVWHYEFQTSVKVCASDGPNIVCAQCQIIYIFLNEVVLHNSVSVEIDGLRREDFLDFYTFRRFLEVMSTLYGKLTPHDISVFSVQEYQLNALPHLNVSFFVTSQDSPLSSWRLEEALMETQRNLSTMFIFPIQLLQDELCRDEPCAYYQKCYRVHKYVQSKEIIETDNFLMHSINTIRSFKCECPLGFTTTDGRPGTCNQRLNMCFANPCLNNGTCVPLESTYRCACPADRIGPNCEFLFTDQVCMPFYCHSGSECQVIKRNGKRSRNCENCKWRKSDTDELCRLRAMSFGGEGYLILPLALSRIEWSLKLTFSTISQSGMLLFAGSEFFGDFLQIYIKRGLPVVEISFGEMIESRVKAELPDNLENHVNDGEWHTLNIELYDQKLRLFLDDCDVDVSLRLKSQHRQCAAESEYQLSAKCSDLSVPCYRFLDLPPFASLGGRPKNHNDRNAINNNPSPVENAFVGCVKNVYLNEELIHFSDLDQFEQVGGGIEPGCRKFRPDHCAFEDPCHINSHINNETSSQMKCIDKWLGHLCKCPHKVHSDARCHLLSGHARKSAEVANTFLEESYAIWHLPDAFVYPFQLYLEFRTREQITQLIALEFEAKSQRLLISLDGGQIITQLNSEQYMMTFPRVADGVWHSIFINLEANFFNFTVDHLYSKFVNLSQYDLSLPLSVPQMLYTGLAPSSSHPHSFVGCIRNVEMNSILLPILEQLRTTSGCITQNTCMMATTVCPKMSKCYRDWDRYKCQCFPGFAGDWCMDVCSINGICGIDGTCARTASGNDTHSYDCICSEGRIGRNCERQEIPKFCPKGWFGNFSNCRQCNCNVENGFLGDCNQITGKCLCKPGTYLRHNSGSGFADECVPCECGYGARNSSVCSSVNGQCECLSEAMGRRCDRCSEEDVDENEYYENENRKTLRPNPANNFATKLFTPRIHTGLSLELELSSLKCVHIHNKCSSKKEFGVQWPTTPKGVTVQNLCPDGQLGIMTRKCTEFLQWTAIRADNCTIPQLVGLKVTDNVDLIEISFILLNATHNSFYLKDRNYDIIIDVLRNMIRHKNLKDAIKDQKFLRNFITISLRIMKRYLYDTRHDIITSRQFDTLILILDKLGNLLVKYYQKLTYLRPFHFTNNNNFVFAIDRFISDRGVRKLILPENNVFIAPYFLSSPSFSSRPASSLFRIELDIPEKRYRKSNLLSGAVFYMTLAAEDQQRYPSPLLSFHINLWETLDVNYTDIPKTKEFITNFTINSTTSDLIEVTSITVPLHVSFSISKRSVGSAFSPECAHFFNNPIILEDENAEIQVNYEINWSMSDATMVEYNGSLATCRFGSISKSSNGIFTLLTRSRKFKTFNFSLASGNFHVVWICVALALIFGITLCTIILRRGIRAKLMRCAVISTFLLNSVLFLLLKQNSLTIMLCPFRSAISTLIITTLFAWLLIYSFYIYRALMIGIIKSCTIFSFSFGVVLPVGLSITTYWLGGVCPMSSRSVWLLLASAFLLCLFSFYIIATSFVMTLYDKQFYYTYSKLSIRTSLFMHLGLVILCAVYNGVGLTNIIRKDETSIQNGAAETQNFINILTTIISIYLFIWTNFPYDSSEGSGDSKSAQTMWVDDKGATIAVQDATFDANIKANYSPQKKTIFPTPITKQRTQGGRIYEGLPNEWTPDVVPTETYVHHTLERSLRTPQMSSPMCMPTDLSYFEREAITRDRSYILENLKKNDNSVLHVEKDAISQYQKSSPRSETPRYSHYQHYYTTPNNCCNYDCVSTLDSPKRLRSVTPNLDTYSTLGHRSMHNTSHNSPLLKSSGSGTLKFATTIDDEMNDAYYTYTSKRSKRTPATTFN